MKIKIAMLSMVLCSGCGTQGGYQTTSENAANASNQTTATSPARSPQNIPTAPGFKICSKLPFSPDVTFPRSLSATDDQAFMLALNLSGSFEGETGWANLTNNFDGEGLSMGLLNQTLGTGSLEPLLVQMRNENLTALQESMEPTHAKDFVSMIDQWSDAAAFEISESRKSVSASGTNPDNGLVALSPLDEGWPRTPPSDEESGSIRSEFSSQDQASSRVLNSRNGASVRWAVANLYGSNGKFIASWADDINRLTTTPEYISIQLNAALSLHKQAIGLEKTIKCKELRCYLLMFDFEVQNGGVPAIDLEDYAKYVAANPSATETVRLKHLVSLRVRHVRKQYVADVTARKDAIIDGAGQVHSEARNFQKEYCFDRLATYPQ